IVKEMNERHGEDLTKEHLLAYDQMMSSFDEKPDVVGAAIANNDFEAFLKIAFAPVFLDTVINQANANDEILKLILADPRFLEASLRYVGRSVYDTARSG
ncbi:MAG: hypothetical protein ACFCU2_03250, partial [Acidimicrobiia bacterium]